MDLLEKYLNTKIQEETTKLNDLKKNKRQLPQASTTKNLNKEFSHLQNAALNPETEKLSEAQLLRLQQLMSSSSNFSEETNNQESPTTAPSSKPRSNNTNFYETNIDPLWYLTNGPFIIFPRDMIPHLQIQDFVEYFRAYPRLNWSKYPKLKQAVFERLTEQERATLQQYQAHYDQKNKRLNRLYNFVQYSTRIPSSRSQQGGEEGIFPNLNIWEELNGSENAAADAMNKYYKRNTRALLEDFFELCKLWIIRFIWKGIWFFADVMKMIVGR